MENNIKMWAKDMHVLFRVSIFYFAMGSCAIPNEGIEEMLYGEKHDIPKELHHMN